VSAADRMALDLAFTARGQRTVLTRRRYRWPLLIGRVFTDPDAPSTGSVTVQNAAGTIIPGDVIRMRVEVGGGGSAVVRGQGATTVSGVPGGAVACEHSEVRVADDSTLVLDTPPRILTAYAHYQQHMQVCLGVGSRLLLVDAVVLHPELTAATFGGYESTVQVYGPDGAVRAVDAQRLMAPPRVRRAPTAFGSVYCLTGGAHVLPDTAAQLEALTDLGGPRQVYTGVSELPNGAGQLVRIAASDGGRLRSTIDAVREVLAATMQSDTSSPLRCTR
jgi:urease accessory protein